jgi:hypothetical protein
MNTPLPPQGPHGPDDDLPDDAGLAALYRKLPQNEPSAALDAAILHAAAQAIAATDATGLPHGERRQATREPGDWVRPKPHGADTPINATRTARAPRHRSLVALASAASLVLVAGLAWHMREMPTVQPEASAVAPSVDDSAGAKEPAARTPPIAASKPAADVTPDRRDASASGAVAAKPSMRAMAAPVPEISQNAAAAPSRMSAAGADSAANMQPAGAAKAMAAPPMKDQAMDKQAEASRRFAKRESNPYPPAPPAMPAPMAEISAAPPVPSPAAPAPPPVAEVSAAPAMPVPAPATVAPAPQRIVGSAAATEDSTASSAPDLDSPETRELVAIRKLFATHHDDEGEQRLQQFHRLHPQWQLPADLQARLREP